MKTTRTQETPSTIRLSIEASAQEVEPSLDRAFRELSQSVKVPGFRQGKVPRKILEARLEPDEIREAALREAIPALLSEAVKDEELQPIVPPSVEISSYEVGGSLAFDATVEVRPAINLPDLGSLVVSRPAVDVKEEEVAEQLTRLRERYATLESTARPLEAGGFGLIDLRTYVHDTTIDEATATDLMYEVGSGQIAPELDTELTGKRAGDILKFNTTLPETLSGPHAGKEVSMQVLVKETKQKVLPDLDDELAKTASEFETLDELRAEIRRHLAEAKERGADLEVRARVIEQLVDSSDVDPPPSLVREELEYRAARFGERLRQAGVNVQQYLEATGETEETLERDLRTQAERSVEAQLVLEEVAKREELTITTEEIDQEVLRHAQEMAVEPAELRKNLERSQRIASLAGDILRRKALEMVVSRAEIRNEDS